MVLFCFLQTNPASLPFSFHTQSFQSDSTSFDMRYKMRAGASGVNGDKGRKGERRSESDGREGEVDGMRREGDGRGGKEIEWRRKRESIICFFLYRLWWQFVYAKTLSV